MSADKQARFHQLGRDKDVILASVAQEQAAVDEIVHQIENLKARLAPLAATLNEKKSPIFDIDRERAAISRALGGKTGAA